MNKKNQSNLIRAHIKVRGIVQGVGFRPFIYNLAKLYDLMGWIYNSSEDVTIEIEGCRHSINKFKDDITAKAPPMSHVADLSIDFLQPVGYDRFEIRDSIAEAGKYQLVSPDSATCIDCVRELFDPEDRRYRYPFTNCTNCGPRFTIINSMPYDRPRTTMKNFIMCPQCYAEYQDPADRRFHAQPNACPVCGPVVELVSRNGDRVSCKDPVLQASTLLKEGAIVAIKGLGGFLLACDATNSTVVTLLRQRKRRLWKPFAVMVDSIETAKEHCDIFLKEEELLCSSAAPIVLMKWKADSSIVESVAPRQKYLGLMLPYSPIHHLIARDSGIPLVMTSGNISEEPIAKDNEEALIRLHEIADYFLIHNRDIYSRYDDSVAMVEHGKSQILRRARGYAPYPIQLDFQCRQILACGAEIKNTFCLTRDNYAFISQHIGDMENIETLEHFQSTVDLYKNLFNVDPELIAYDLHPDYLSTRYAHELEEAGAQTIGILHHHAHVASCMAENGINSPVIGVVLDGTGWGNDGNIWGGEYVVADYSSFTRSAHLEYLPLAGGDIATKRPYRIATSYLLSLLGDKVLDKAISLSQQYYDRFNGESTESFHSALSTTERNIIKQQIQKKINTPQTSSMGRLFDAVSALIGIREVIDYEGQAAIELEMAAHAVEEHSAIGKYPYTIVDNDGMQIIKLADLFSAVIDDMADEQTGQFIAMKFHRTVASMSTDICRHLSEKTGIKKVALSGGVFQNRLLLRQLTALLEKDGFNVITHRLVPCNDGCISLGQAVIANFSG